MVKKTRVLLLPTIIGLVMLSGCNKQPLPSNSKTPVSKKQGIYAQIENNYASMTKLAETIDCSSSKQELKKQIMIHNDQHNKKRSKSMFGAQYQDLPFVQYKNILDKQIKQLERSLKKLLKKRTHEKEQENEIRTLITQLENLNQVIVTSDEYRQEKLKLAEKSSSWGIFNFGLGSLVRKIIPV
jgi:hypothetical protein